MDTAFLILLGVGIVIVVLFLGAMLLETRRTHAALRKTIEERLNPTLDELQANLRNTRAIAENVNLITEDLRSFSRSVGEVGETVGAVKGAVDKLNWSTTVKVLSLRTGVMVGLQYFIENLLKKGDKHE